MRNFYLLPTGRNPEALFKIACTIMILAMTACAARPANPVRLAQLGDETLSCDQLAGQIDQNQRSINGLVKADKDLENENVVRAIVGLHVDLSQVEQIEARALIDRNERLERLAAAQNCPATG